MPEVVSAQVHVPAVEQLIGAATATKLTIDKDYVAGWKGTPAGEVFARLDGLPLEFKADQSGGVATPNIMIGGLSRRFGPRRRLGQQRRQVQPEHVRPGGVLRRPPREDPRRDRPRRDRPAGVPVEPRQRARGYTAPGRATACSDGDDHAAHVDAASHRIGPYKPKTPPQGKPSFHLECHVRKVLAGNEAPTTTVRGELRAFDLNLFGFVVLPFETLEFDAKPNEKMHVSAEVRPADLRRSARVRQRAQRLPRRGRLQRPAQPRGHVGGDQVRLLARDPEPCRRRDDAAEHQPRRRSEHPVRR